MEEGVKTTFKKCLLLTTGQRIFDINQPWWLSSLERQFSHSVDLASGGSNPAWGMLVTACHWIVIWRYGLPRLSEIFVAGWGLEIGVGWKIRWVMSSTI